MINWQRAFIIFAAAMLLGCLAPGPEEVAQRTEALQLPPYCEPCITCNYADLPSFTIDPLRFTIMRFRVQGKIDSAYAAGDSVVRLVAFRECRTITCDVAMVAIIKFQAGNTYRDIDCTVVNPIDTTVTGVP